MLFSFLYSCLRLLLDIADVRLRIDDPEMMAAFHRLVARYSLGIRSAHCVVVVSQRASQVGALTSDGQACVGNELSSCAPALVDPLLEIFEAEQELLTGGLVDELLNLDYQLR